MDLTAALAVAGGSWERQHWLEEMLLPGGMSPGSSSRAHARAFRFAEALMKRGYVVAEGPFGPRGGRRFTLDGYEGARAGVIYRLKGDRACYRAHPTVDCGCFDDLSDGQLKLLGTLHRRIRRAASVSYGSDLLADVVREHDEVTVRLAVDLFVTSRISLRSDPTVEDYVRLLAHHDVDALRTAVGLYVRAHGIRRGGPSVEEYLRLLAHHDARVLEVAVDLFTSNDTPAAGRPALPDLIGAIEKALS